MGCTSSQTQCEQPCGRREVPTSFAKISQDALATALDSVRFEAKYRVGTQIGEGSFGSVFAVQCTGDAERLAMKAVVFGDRTEQSSERSYQKALWEGRVWQKVCQNTSAGAANVLQLKETFVMADACFFVMELADASLWDHLCQLPEVHEGTYAGIVGEMLRGLAHVHGCSVVHRDIKNGNFMVRDGTVKLIDFGLAESLPVEATGCLHGCVGTAPWMSPEVVADLGHGASTDLWSLGVVAYTMLCGRFPHMPKDLNEKTMKAAIQTGEFGPDFRPVEGTISQDAEGFLKALLARSASQRPSAKEACRLPFVGDPGAREPSGSQLEACLFHAYRCGAF